MTSPVLTLTPAAATHVESMLAKQPEASIFCLGVKVTGCHGYMYVPELAPQATEDMVLVDSTTSFQIYVKRDATSIIKGTVIDFELKSMGIKQLTFDNPNAEGLCGCGESFNLKKELAE